MLKYSKIIVLVIVLTFASTALFAQGLQQGDARHGRMPFGKWWRNPNAMKKLNLTQEEIRKLDEQFSSHARTFIKLKHAVELEQFEMDQLLESTTLDESALMAQFTKLEKARADLSKERFHYLVQVRKTLGPERFQTIKSFRKKMFREKIARHKKQHKKRQHNPE